MSHVTIFGSFLDLATLAPFYTHVAADDGQGNHGRFTSRPVLARYIGPARDCGIGAIRMMAGRHTRVVRTWRFLAAPSDARRHTDPRIAAGGGDR